MNLKQKENLKIILDIINRKGECRSYICWHVGTQGISPMKKKCPLGPDVCSNDTTSLNRAKIYIKRILDGQAE